MKNVVGISFLVEFYLFNFIIDNTNFSVLWLSNQGGLLATVLYFYLLAKATDEVKKHLKGQADSEF